MQRIVSLLLVLALLLSMGTLTAFASGEEPVTIYFTNDVHTYLEKDLGYQTVAALKKDTPNALLVDAGDHAQGTANGGMDKGHSIIEIMNAAGYDLATLGNHEFDYDMDGALYFIEHADFDYISCNLRHEDALLLDAVRTFEIGGMKIGFVGVTTPESITKSTPAYFQDEEGNFIYSIDAKEAMYADVQKAVDSLKADGCDYIIGLGHLGVDPSSEGNTSLDVIANTAGFDAFIDGHSHSTVNGRKVSDKEGREVVLCQTGEYFSSIGEMTLADGGLSVRLLDAATVAAERGEDYGDADVAKAVKDLVTSVKDALGQKIAESDIDFTIYFANEEDLFTGKNIGDRAVRLTNTNVFDLDADAYYYYINSVCSLDCDVAFMNGGGVRASVPAGDWTYASCKTVNTFGNVLCLMEVPGRVILDALEFGARLWPVESGGFLNAAGLTYTIDANVPSTVSIDENAIWQAGPSGEYRVRDVMVYNKEKDAYEPLDLEKTYTLGGINYTLMDMGDGFNMFTAENGVKLVLDGLSEDYLAFAEYLKNFRDTDGNGYGNIASANSPLLTEGIVGENYLFDYEDPAGAERITVIEPEADPWDGKVVIGGLELNVWFSKYGNTYCDCTVDHFLGTEDNGFGFSVGDIVTVKFLGKEIDLPVVNGYNDVDSGSGCIKVGGNSYVEFGINMGNFASTYELAHIEKQADGTYRITAWEGVEYPVELTFAMKEKGGYLEEMEIRNLTRTDERGDYDDLTDAEFANFREVETAGMGDDTLYRGSSPIDPGIGRSTYADKALKDAGVTVIMNLGDDKATAENFEGFGDSYYAGQNVIYLNLDTDLLSEGFGKGLATGLRFFARKEFEGARFYVHCSEGKDRTGIVAAVLEALMGASADEIVDDYLVTFDNYYNVVDGEHVALHDRTREKIAASNIVASLEKLFGVEDLGSADLAAEAGEFLKSVGLSDAEIAQLKINLGPKVPNTGDGSMTVVWSALMMACLACVTVLRKRED